MGDPVAWPHVCTVPVITYLPTPTFGMDWCGVVVWLWIVVLGIVWPHSPQPAHTALYSHSACVPHAAPHPLQHYSLPATPPPCHPLPLLPHM